MADIFFTHGTSCGTSAVTEWWSWNEEASTAATTNVWRSWIDSGTTNVATGQKVKMPRQTPAEAAAIVTRMKEEQKAAAERQAAFYKMKQEESTRARALLLGALDEPARIEYEKTGKIYAIGQISGSRYEIMRGRQHNVWRLDASGMRVEELCVHVADEVPNEDNILAQKLMIEGAEQVLLATANRRAVAV